MSAHEWFESRREQVGTHAVDCWKYHPDCAYWVGRQEAAAELERLAGNRNPDDPEGSAEQSRLLVSLAHRIRFPQEYEGVARAAADGVNR